MAIPVPEALKPGGDFLEAQKMANFVTEQALNNRMKEIENQYSPEKMRLANENQANVNKWYEPNIKSEINKRDIEANYVPKKYEIEGRNSLTRQKELGSRNLNSFRMLMQTPEGQQLLMKDPKLRESFLNAVQESAGGYGYNNQPETSIPVPTQEQGKMPVDNPSNYGAKDPQSSYLSPEIGSEEEPSNKTSQPKIQSEQNLSKKEQLDAIETGASDAYARTNLPADIKKKLFAGKRFQVTADQVKSNFSLAKQYFSPSGQIQLGKDEAKAAKNKIVPRSLQAYREFKQGIEALNLQGAVLEGVPATQISREDYKKIFDMPKFFNSPEGAESLLNNGIALAMMADEANKTPLGELMGDRSTVKTSPEVSEKRIQVISPQGVKGTIPESHWPEAEKSNYKRIG